MSTMVYNPNANFIPRANVEQELYIAVQNREPQNAKLIFDYLASSAGIERFCHILKDSGMLLEYINDALLKISTGELNKETSKSPGRKTEQKAATLPANQLNLQRNVSYPNAPYYVENGVTVRPSQPPTKKPVQYQQQMPPQQQQRMQQTYPQQQFYQPAQAMYVTPNYYPQQQQPMYYRYGNVVFRAQ